MIVGLRQFERPSAKGGLTLTANSIQCSAALATADTIELATRKGHGCVAISKRRFGKIEHYRWLFPIREFLERVAHSI
jgi:hypothetical protein